MKKLLPLTLAAAMLLAALTSCRMPEKKDPFKDILEENPEIELPKSEIMEVDPEDIPIFEINDALSNYEEEMTFDIPAEGDHAAGKLIVKYQIYDFAYEDRNVAIVSVENHSTQALTVSIDGVCENTLEGKTKRITRGFEGFAANWQNYILFYPEFAFDHFEYEIEYEPFTGEAYSQYIYNLEYDGLWLTPKYYYDGRPYNVVMHKGWTLDYEHNQSAYFAAEYMLFDANGKKDIFDMEKVVHLDFVCEDGITPLKPEHGTYQTILYRTLGVDRDTLWDTVGFSYDNSLGESCVYFPAYDAAVPYNPPEPFDDVQGLLCWNAIGKSDTQPPLGATDYFPTWAMDQWAPPPSGY